MKQETKSRTGLAHETFMNPSAQQQFPGCFAESRESPVKHFTCQSLKHVQMDGLHSDSDKVLNCHTGCFESCWLKWEF